MATYKGSFRVFLSDCLQLAIGILALVACIQAANRSGAFGRTFWRLAAAAFSILIVGMGLGTYNDSFLASSIRHSWLIDLFTNTWLAPLAISLFLDPGACPERRMLSDMALNLPSLWCSNCTPSAQLSFNGADKQLNIGRLHEIIVYLNVNSLRRTLKPWIASQ
jgi:hypothetical protein